MSIWLSLERRDPGYIRSSTWRRQLGANRAVTFRWKKIVGDEGLDMPVFRVPAPGS